MAQRETSRSTARHLAGVAPTVEAPALFVQASVDWMLDSSIPIEVRNLLMILYAEAMRVATERRDAGGGLGDFDQIGRAGFAIPVNFEWIMRTTGWTITQTRSIVALAMKMELISRQGKPRTGFRYQVNVGLKTYRRNPDGETARSLFAAHHAPPAPKDTSQQRLAIDIPPSPAPGMAKWSRTDRAFYDGSPAPIRAFFGSLNGKQRKLFVRMGATDQAATLREVDAAPDLYLRPTEANELDHVRRTEAITALLLRRTEPNDELQLRRTYPNRTASNVRARGPESIQNVCKTSIAEVLTTDARRELLLLAQKRKGEETTTDSTRSFVAAIERVATTLLLFCDDDAPRARDLLMRVLADERVTGVENPIGALVAGVCNDPPYLLTAKAAAGSPSYDRALERLPWPLRDSVLERVRSGRLTDQWCRERDISADARAAAATRIANEEPPAAVAGPALPPPRRILRSGGVPAVPLATPEVAVRPELPAWWPALAAAMRERLSGPMYETWFAPLVPGERADAGPTIVAPSTFVLVQLRKALGRDLASELEDLGFYGEVVVEAGP